MAHVELNRSASGSGREGGKTWHVEEVGERHGRFSLCHAGRDGEGRGKARACRPPSRPLSVGSCLCMVSAAVYRRRRGRLTRHGVSLEAKY